MKINTFVEKWNNKKYDNTENTWFNNWKAVKRAEIIKQSDAYPIGYFVGTTERGYYDTAIKSLMEEFDNEIEISFKSIYQPGVSTKVWKLARTTAERQYRNINSKDHKIIKFAMAPSALIVYVGNPKLKQRLGRNS